MVVDSHSQVTCIFLLFTYFHLFKNLIGVLFKRNKEEIHASNIVVIASY